MTLALTSDDRCLNSALSLLINSAWYRRKLVQLFRRINEYDFLRISQIEGFAGLVK